MNRRRKVKGLGTDSRLLRMAAGFFCTIGKSVERSIGPNTVTLCHLTLFDRQEDNFGNEKKIRNGKAD